MGDRDASTRSPPGRAYRHGGTPASCMCSFNSKPGAARARAKRPLSCGRATLAAMDETPRPFRCARSMPRRLGREARRPMISGMRRAVRALRQLQRDFVLPSQWALSKGRAWSRAPDDEPGLEAPVHQPVTARLPQCSPVSSSVDPRAHCN
jgi:hypothetical protein